MGFFCRIGCLFFLLQLEAWSSKAPSTIARLSDLDAEKKPATDSAERVKKKEDLPLRDIQDEVKKKLVSALKKRIQDPFQLDLDHRLVCEGDVDFQLEDVMYAENTGRVTARAVFDHVSYDPLQISGKVTLLVSMPVTVRVIQVGETIQESDVTMALWPMTKSSQGVWTEMKDIVGTQVRAMPLKPGLPIRKTDVLRPHWVKKGEAVEGLLETPRMSIAMPLRALESGEEGKRILLENEKSEKKIYGVVVAPRRVHVMPAYGYTH